MGLNDIRQLVHLMSLTAGGRVELPSDTAVTIESHGISSPIKGSSQPPLAVKANQFLQHLGNAISSLATSNSEAANMVVNICTKVFLLYYFFYF